MTFKAEMLGKEHYPRTNVFISEYDGILFIKLYHDWEKSKSTSPHALNFNAFNQIITFCKLANSKHWKINTTLPPKNVLDDEI